MRMAVCRECHRKEGVTPRIAVQTTGDDEEAGRRFDVIFANEFGLAGSSTKPLMNDLVQARDMVSPSCEAMTRLQQFVVPSVRRCYTREDVAKYALSIGLGHDPLDALQLRFVDFSKPMWVVPTFAIVLGSPGFWMGNQETGIDPSKVLHTEQRLRVHSPLPDSGEVRGVTSVERTVDLGVGRGALLYTRTLLTEAATSRLVSESEATFYIRGAGGFGGPSGPARPTLDQPDGDPESRIRVQTRPEQALWYRLNGDFNLIHADPLAAKQAGFERPILHGLCTLGIACQSLLRAIGDRDVSPLQEISARFLAPVFPGETLETWLWRGGEFTTFAVERGIAVLRGNASTLDGQPQRFLSPPPGSAARRV